MGHETFEDTGPGREVRGQGDARYDPGESGPDHSRNKISDYSRVHKTQIETLNIITHHSSAPIENVCI